MQQAHPEPSRVGGAGQNEQLPAASEEDGEDGERGIDIGLVDAGLSDQVTDQALHNIISGAAPWAAHGSRDV